MMGETIETYEVRGGFRVLVEHDRDASNPRTENDGGVLRLVPLEALNNDGRTSGHLESLGFDAPYELGELADAWDRLGGESGERFALKSGPGLTWEAVPGWPALADFGAAPVARWARIFHGVELETVEAGENRAVAWIDPELVAQYGAPLYEDRAGALAMIGRELKPYTDWAEGSVYGVIIEDKDGDELEACWGLYLDPFDELEVLEAADGYAGGKVGRRISERLEVVRELDTLRKRLHRAEALARWERRRADALARARFAEGQAAGVRIGLRALDGLGNGRLLDLGVAIMALSDGERIATADAARARVDTERAAGYLSELSR